MPVDVVREVLAWCRANPDDPEALPRLNELRDALRLPACAAEVLDAAEAVTRPVMAQAAPTPLVHAHMTILLAALLDVESQRPRVDKLFAEWLRHPTSYGSARATPPAFQRLEFVQRVADLLGWGELYGRADHDTLDRFLSWVNTWVPKHKFQARRTLDAMRRNFLGPDLWHRVHFPSPGDHDPGPEAHGHQGHQGRHGRHGRHGRRGHGKPATDGPAAGKPAADKPAADGPPTDKADEADKAD